MRTAQREQEAPAPPSDDFGKVWVIWKCMECNVNVSGRRFPTEFKTPRCQGVPKSKIHSFGRICGGAMIEIHRSDAR